MHRLFLTLGLDFAPIFGENTTNKNYENMSNFLRAVQDLPTCQTLKTMHRRNVSSTLHFFYVSEFYGKRVNKNSAKLVSQRTLQDEAKGIPKSL